MTTNETLYTLTVNYRIETTYLNYNTYSHYTYQFVGLSGLHSAMNCVKESRKCLNSPTAKYRIYRVDVDRAIILR